MFFLRPFIFSILFFPISVLPAAIDMADTNKINAIESNINELNKAGKKSSSIGDLKSAVSLSKKTPDKHKLSVLYNHLASTYTSIGKLDSGFWYADSALKQALLDKKPTEISQAYRNLGILHYTKSDFPNALSCLVTALQYIETTNDSISIARALSTLGLVYGDVKDFENSILCLNKALVMQERLNDDEGKIKTLNNMGVYYYNTGRDSLALKYYKKSLDICIKLNDKEAIALRKGNIGFLLIGMGRYSEAEKELLSSIEIRKEINDLKGLPSSYLKLALLFVVTHEYDKALKYVDMAEMLNYGSYETFSQINEVRYKAYAGKGDYRTAFEYFKKYSAYRDTLNNEAKNKAIAEISSRYEYEKKEKEIALLTQEKKISDLEIEQQSHKIKRFRYGIIFSSIGAVFLGLSVFLLYSRYNNKKKLSQELERKNTQITRSINYAKRIQGALIPSKYLLVNYFSESFVLYRPKDIVSGDFYWISDKGNKIIIAVADCTGHGIPGAFLSMIGNTLLNEIVNHKKIQSPSAILTQLNDSIVSTLGQTNVNLATQDDGMDIGIFSFDKKSREMIFAGANHSLVLFKNNELLTIKGELFSIGGFSKNFAKAFPEHRISDLNPGDMLYIFTDGYYDQFGGENRKKFMSQRFKNLLQEIHTRPADMQKNVLEKKLLAWQGKEPQTDDILIMGLRV